MSDKKPKRFQSGKEIFEKYIAGYSPAQPEAVALLTVSTARTEGEQVAENLLKDFRDRLGKLEIDKKILSESG